MNYRIRKYFLILPAFALLFGVTACDSDDNDEDLSDSEAFVGNWTVASVSDTNGAADLSSDFNSIVARFNASGDGSITVDAIDDTNDAAVDFTYSVNETANTIVLNISIPGVGTIPLSMGYSISSDGDTVTFTINQQNAVLINSLFGTALEGAVTMTVVRS
ncbi:MAG: hypothetical protein KJO98_11055 [Rhodothermia bacterium]|nr:hypothetical protein [Rhodothermia bacterium]